MAFTLIQKSSGKGDYLVLFHLQKSYSNVSAIEVNEETSFITTKGSTGKNISLATSRVKNEFFLN